jgi:hypothetical protein
VASNKTLNAKNLTALGAARLAELLIEVSTDNAAAKRRLRLELAGAQSPGEVGKEVRKRLTAIARFHTFIDWQNRKALVGDLETQRRAIVDQIAKTGRYLGYGPEERDFVRFWMSGYYNAAADSNVLNYDRFQRNSAKITAYCRKNKSKSLPTAIKNIGLWQ